MFLEQIERLVLTEDLFDQIVAHARRKLARGYQPGEEEAPKAYGLVGGKLSSGTGEITHVFPLRRNLRDDPRHKPAIDEVLEESAFPSETPLAGRAWVSDPAEVMDADRQLDQAGSVLFGGYHMHRVAWDHDPVRDTCTEVDRRLADGTGLWMLILSMVEPEQPRLRAFFEGDNSREAMLQFGHDR